MITRSIVLKLWLTLMALIVVVMVPLGLTLNSMFTRYHQAQAAQPLREHATMLAQMVEREPHSMDQVPMMAEAAEVEWMLLGPDAKVIGSSAPAPPLPPAEALQQLNVHDVTIGEIDYGGAPHIFAAIQVPGSVALVLFRDATPAHLALTRMRQLLLLGGLGTTLLATGIAFWLSKTLTRPLIEMKVATRAIAKGDQAEVSVRSNDELGELGQAINELSGHLYRLDRNRREFVAHVAHELKTPLSYVRGFSQALAENLVPSPEMEARYKQTIYRESVRLSSLVEDLLDLSQLEEGRFRLEKQSVPINGLLDRVLLQVQPLAQQKQITLRLQLPEPGFQVIGDPQRLTQVLLNLVDNALKHTGSGGRVELRARCADGGVLIEVEDTGSGIPPEELALIWERFHKVDRSRSGSGRGLGLAIARQIVRAHGGWITAASEVGKGTTISFWVPKS